jgi:hypothetical protein
MDHSTLSATIGGDMAGVERGAGGSTGRKIIPAPVHGVESVEG